jgi:AraC family transcriptional regulator
MDDQQLSYERADMAERMISAFQAGDMQRGPLPRVVHETETERQLRTNKLLMAMPQIIETLTGALSKDLEATRQCVRHASATLLSCVRDADNSLGAAVAHANERVAYRGGLAPWQARTLTTYIDANLSASLSCEALARLARLSVSYFARAFKSTFGYSPHEFLVRRRLDRARVLMLQTDAPLAQIALECGFADQAHLSRIFLRFTGERPASWRRARWNGES